MVLMAGLCHHSLDFIFFRSIGLSQIGSLFNRQWFDTHIRNTFQPTRPKTPPLPRSRKAQHSAGWGCMKTAADRKQSRAEDALGSPYATAGGLWAWEPTWKEPPWALQTLGSLSTSHKDSCNQSNVLPSGLKLCVGKIILPSTFKRIFKPQTIWSRR